MTKTKQQSAELDQAREAVKAAEADAAEAARAEAFQAFSEALDFVRGYGLEFVQDLKKLEYEAPIMHPGGLRGADKREALQDDFKRFQADKENLFETQQIVREAFWECVKHGSSPLMLFLELFDAAYGSVLYQDEWTEAPVLYKDVETSELERDPVTGEVLKNPVTGYAKHKTCKKSEPAHTEILWHRLEEVLGYIVNNERTFERKLRAWFHDRKVNPVKDHLMECYKRYPEDLPEWDRMAEILFGVTDELSQQMLEKWIVASVKRVLKPGCAFKYTLVLSGKQSIGKSPFFRIMARMPDEGKESSKYYLCPKSTDSEEHLKRLRAKRWIIELAELEGITQKMAVEDLKVILGDIQDVWKINHQEVEHTIPRHYIFGASVNSESVFKDKTGNERFWVIECGDRPINLEWLEDHLEHIRATAVRKLLERGFDIDPTSEMAKESEARNGNYMSSNDVMEWVEWFMDECEKARVAWNETMQKKGIAEVWESLAIKHMDLVELLPSRLKSQQNTNAVKQAMLNLGFKQDANCRPVNAAKTRAYYKPGCKSTLVGFKWLEEVFTKAQTTRPENADPA